MHCKQLKDRSPTDTAGIERSGGGTCEPQVIQLVPEKSPRRRLGFSHCRGQDPSDQYPFFKTLPTFHLLTPSSQDSVLFALYMATAIRSSSQSTARRGSSGHVSPNASCSSCATVDFEPAHVSDEYAASVQTDVQPRMHVNLG